MWREPEGVRFRTLVADRQAVALDCGTAKVSD